jgi:hypothetical protein
MNDKIATEHLIGRPTAPAPTLIDGLLMIAGTAELH